MLRTGQSSALCTCWKYGSACKHAMLLMLLTPTSKVRAYANVPALDRSSYHSSEGIPPLQYACTTLHNYMNQHEYDSLLERDY